MGHFCWLVPFPPPYTLPFPGLPPVAVSLCDKAVAFLLQPGLQEVLLAFPPPPWAESCSLVVLENLPICLGYSMAFLSRRWVAAPSKAQVLEEQDCGLPSHLAWSVCALHCWPSHRSHRVYGQNHILGVS